VGGGRLEAEVGENLLNHLRLLDERDVTVMMPWLGNRKPSPDPNGGRQATHRAGCHGVRDRLYLSYLAGSPIPLAALRPERLDDLRRLTEKLERVAAIIARVPIMSHNPRCVRIFRSPR